MEDSCGSPMFRSRMTGSCIIHSTAYKCQTLVAHPTVRHNIKYNLQTQLNLFQLFHI